LISIKKNVIIYLLIIILLKIQIIQFKMQKFLRLYLFLLSKIKHLPILQKQTYPIFIILGHPRTGTSLLHTYLNSHPQLLSLNEALSNEANLTNLLSPKPFFIKAVGFKFFYEYIKNEDKQLILFNLLKNWEVKIINIKRKNLLRIYASLLIAEKTQEWSSTESNTKNHKSITINAEECEKAFYQYKSLEKIADEFVAQSNAKIIEVEYESYIEFPDLYNYKILKFLGLKPIKLHSLLKKQNPEPLENLISNYTELKDYFKNSEFEIFFE